MQPIWETLNPMQPGISAAEKDIRATTLLLALVGAWQAATGVRLAMRIGVGQSAGSWLLYVLEHWLVLAIAVACWRRWRLGWMLLLPFLACTMLSGLLTGWYALTWRPSRFAAVDTMFPQPPLAGPLALALVAGYLLYRLSRADVRAAFAIGAGQQRITLLLAVALALGMLAMLGGGL